MDSVDPVWNPDDYSWDPYGLVAQLQEQEHPGLTANAGSRQHPPLPAGPEPSAEGRPTPTSKTAAMKGPRCQVQSCGIDLSEEKAYFKRYHVCPKHLKMLSLQVEGRMCRFCQQCGRFQEVSEFDDNKRSCRVQLQKHNERRRKMGVSKTIVKRGARSQLNISEVAQQMDDVEPQAHLVHDFGPNGSQAQLLAAIASLGSGSHQHKLEPSPHAPLGVQPSRPPRSAHAPTSGHQHHHGTGSGGDLSMARANNTSFKASSSFLEAVAASAARQRRNSPFHITDAEGTSLIHGGGMGDLRAGGGIGVVVKPSTSGGDSGVFVDATASFSNCSSNSADNPGGAATASTGSMGGRDRLPASESVPLYHCISNTSGTAALRATYSERPPSAVVGGGISTAAVSGRIAASRTISSGHTGGPWGRPGTSTNPTSGATIGINSNFGGAPPPSVWPNLQVNVAGGGEGGYTNSGPPFVGYGGGGSDGGLAQLPSADGGQTGCADGAGGGVMLSGHHALPSVNSTAAAAAAAQHNNPWDSLMWDQNSPSTKAGSAFAMQQQLQQQQQPGDHQQQQLPCHSFPQQQQQEMQMHSQQQPPQQRHFHLQQQLQQQQHQQWIPVPPSLQPALGSQDLSQGGQNAGGDSASGAVTSPPAAHVDTTHATNSSMSHGVPKLEAKSEAADAQQEWQQQELELLQQQRQQLLLVPEDSTEADDAIMSVFMTLLDSEDDEMGATRERASGNVANGGRHQPLLGQPGAVAGNGLQQDPASAMQAADGVVAVSGGSGVGVPAVFGGTSAVPQSPPMSHLQFSAPDQVPQPAPLQPGQQQFGMQYPQYTEQQSLQQRQQQQQFSLSNLNPQQQQQQQQMYSQQQQQPSAHTFQQQPSPTHPFQQQQQLPQPHAFQQQQQQSPTQPFQQSSTQAFQQLQHSSTHPFQQQSPTQPFQQSSTHPFQQQSPTQPFQQSSTHPFQQQSPTQPFQQQQQRQSPTHPFQPLMGPQQQQQQVQQPPLYPDPSFHSGSTHQQQFANPSFHPSMQQQQQQPLSQQQLLLQQQQLQQKQLLLRQQQQEQLRQLQLQQEQQQQQLLLEQQRMEQQLLQQQQHQQQAPPISSFDMAVDIANGGGRAATYVPQETLSRVSLKLRNCTPDQLPADLRERLAAWVAQADAVVLQGFIRPGCTHLTLDLSVPTAVARHGQLAGRLFGSRSALDALEAAVSGLPGRVEVQLDDQVVILDDGRTVSCLQTDHCSEQLALQRVGPAAIVTGRDAQLHLWGISGSGPAPRCHARIQGRHVPVFQPQDLVVDDGRCGLRVELAAVAAPGLVLVECEAASSSSASSSSGAVLLSEWQPMVVVDDPMVAAELNDAVAALGIDSMRPVLVDVGQLLDAKTACGVGRTGGGAWTSPHPAPPAACRHPSCCHSGDSGVCGSQPQHSGPACCSLFVDHAVGSCHALPSASCGHADDACSVDGLCDGFESWYSDSSSERDGCCSGGCGTPVTVRRSCTDLSCGSTSSEDEWTPAGMQLPGPKHEVMSYSTTRMVAAPHIAAQVRAMRWLTDDRRATLRHKALRLLPFLSKRDMVHTAEVVLQCLTSVDGFGCGEAAGGAGGTSLLQYCLRSRSSEAVQALPARGRDGHVATDAPATGAALAVGSSSRQAVQLVCPTSSGDRESVSLNGSAGQMRDDDTTRPDVQKRVPCGKSLGVAAAARVGWLGSCLRGAGQAPHAAASGPDGCSAAAAAGGRSSSACSPCSIDLAVGSASCPAAATSVATLGAARVQGPDCGASDVRVAAVHIGRSDGCKGDHFEAVWRGCSCLLVSVRRLVSCLWGWQAGRC